MSTIKYKRTVSALGRNGYSNQVGLSLMLDTRIDENNQRIGVIHFQPVNTKGDYTKCWLQIPLENVEELIRELKQIKNDHNSSRRTTSKQD